MKKDGGPAFPLVTPDDWKERAEGMTLLDYFAGKALYSLLQRKRYAHARCEPEALAEESYKYAKAMLSEREK